jgi:hypothetical protein
MMPGKPTGLGHYEFIQDSSSRGSPRLLQQVVDFWVQERRPAAVSPRAFCWKIGRILHGRKQAFVGPPGQSKPHCAHRSSTATSLFCGPPSATCGRVGLPALIATRANPWYVRVSAEPTGVAVGLTAVAVLTQQC